MYCTGCVCCSLCKALRFFNGAPCCAGPSPSCGRFIAAIAPPLPAPEGEMRPGMCFTCDGQVVNVAQSAECAMWGSRVTSHVVSTRVGCRVFGE